MREINRNGVAVECVLVLFIALQLSLLGLGLRLGDARGLLRRVRVVLPIHGITLGRGHGRGGRRLRAGDRLLLLQLRILHGQQSAALLLLLVVLL